jgi:N6-L-threonylcarbamoyladenine synthase
MKILGIETSCDDTSLAVVSADKKILFHKTASQKSNHGGVVPEVASRAHLKNIQELLVELKSCIDLSTIDAVAVTSGPGLIGSLMVGVVYAKAIASVLKKPIIAVNHLAGHALTIRLTDEVAYPYLALLVSGGNTQFLIVKGVDEYMLLGQTLDDALGEAFDKVSKMLGLGYPGGPVVEKRAKLGDESKFAFAKPMIHSRNCDFSFAGLKSDVARHIQRLGTLSEQDINDVCASFQKTISVVLEKKISVALERFAQETGGQPSAFVLCGGVSANKYVAARLGLLCDASGVRFMCSPLELCGDNAAMIAWVGIELCQAGFIDSLHFAPRAKWSLG